MTGIVVEQFQGCDELGGFLPRPLTRDDLTKGALHASAHVWLWRRDHNGAMELLFQERAASKRTWPNFFDISAAGHVDFEEPVIEAALRETREELNLNLDQDKLKLLFVHRQDFTDAMSGVIENEFRWVYGYGLDNTKAFEFADGEVSSVRWLQQEDFAKLLDGSTHFPVVPQGKAYFTSLIEALSLGTNMYEDH